ncbi:MAG: hypothetical protein ACQESG_05735 [Nanobdellota archaeon]
MRIAIPLILLILAGCTPVEKGESFENATNVENIVLGYCPTMSAIASDIAEENSHVSLKPFASTSAAIAGLNSGVDVILVGRLAKSYELDACEKRLRGGLTLVGNEKRFIRMNELTGTVHTAASEEEVREYLPEKTDVVYHDSVDAAIDESEMVLLNWKDYTDDMALVIPVDNNLNKIERFRIPVLYSHDERNLAFENIRLS